MPKAAKSRKTKKQKKPRIDLHAGLAAGIGVFLTASLLYYSGKPHDNEIIGLLGTNLVLGMEKLFGPVSIILPIFLILWAIHMTRARSYWSSRMTGITLISCSVLVYCAMYQIPRGILVWEAARSGLGGGIIGGLITVVLMKLTGTLGTNLIMGISFLAGWFLILNRSLSDLQEILRKWTQDTLSFLDRLMFYEEESKPPEPIIVGGGVKPEVTTPPPHHR